MSVQEKKLIDVWNVDSKPFKIKQKTNLKKHKKVQDLKEYFDFLKQWSKVSLYSKRNPERVDKPFIL